MKALIPLAGQGTRMAPLGISTPKALLPILNKPQILWNLEALQKNGIQEVVLIIAAGAFGEQVKAFLNTSTPQGMQLQYAVQAEQKGNAHAAQMGREFFSAGEEFVVLYGDDLYGPQNIAQVVQAPGLAITGQKVADPEKWGILQTNDQGNLDQVIEKPSSPVGEMANIGCMKLSARTFELFEQLQPSARGEFELTDSINLLAKEVAIKVISSADYWLPLGYPWHVLNATEVLAAQIEPKIEGTVEEHVTIHGNVVLPKSSVIKAGSYLEGNIVVGENTIIGPNAYVRGNVAIGSNCKVGFSVEVKNSVIGDGSQVPHLSYIGDSVLGTNVNFAGQSLTANFRHDGKNVQTPVKGEMMDTGRVKFGAVIGDNVKLGINTKIYPGRKIWPGRTTLPGEVVGKDLT